MPTLFRVLELVAVAALCVLVVLAACSLSLLLVAIIHSNSYGAPVLHSVLVLCAMVACTAMSLALGHGIAEARRAK